MVQSMSLLMSIFAYQALKQYRKATPILPKGYKLSAVLESSSFPRMAFIAESPAHIIVAFRGTEAMEDWLKDVSFSQVPFPYVPHAGFTHKGFTEIYSGLRQNLLKQVNKRPSHKPVYISGHSMGGALAALCALDLAAKRKGPVRLFTFGAPRVGNCEFASALRAKVKLSARFYNPGDWVPRMPPRRLLHYRYEHAGKPVPISFKRSNPLSNHSMAAYMQALCQRSSQFCTRICKDTRGLCP